MKKLIAIIVLVGFSCGVLFSDTLMFLEGTSCDIKRLGTVAEGSNVYVNTQTTSTLELIQRMASQYTFDDQVLIAHSHGGVRALAYAEYLRQNKLFAAPTANNPTPSRVKAIVTIDSPIQGEHALLYGKYQLHERLKARLNTLKASYEVEDNQKAMKKDFDAAAVKKLLEGAGVVLGGAAGCYASAAIIASTTLPFPFGFLPGRELMFVADKCFSSSKFLLDFNNQFSKEIYLTDEHDGFVNTSSMVSPDGNNNSWLLDTKDKSTMSFPDLNHQTSRTSDKVWGVGGSFDLRTIKGGAVNDLLGTKILVREIPNEKDINNIPKRWSY